MKSVAFACVCLIGIAAFGQNRDSGTEPVSAVPEVRVDRRTAMGLGATLLAAIGFGPRAIISGAPAPAVVATPISVPTAAQVAARLRELAANQILNFEEQNMFSAMDSNRMLELLGDREDETLPRLLHELRIRWTTQRRLAFLAAEIEASNQLLVPLPVVQSVTNRVLDLFHIRCCAEAAADLNVTTPHPRDIAQEQRIWTRFISILWSSERELVDTIFLNLHKRASESWASAANPEHPIEVDPFLQSLLDPQLVHLLTMQRLRDVYIARLWTIRFSLADVGDVDTQHPDWDVPVEGSRGRARAQWRRVDALFSSFRSLSLFEQIQFIANLDPDSSPHILSRDLDPLLHEHERHHFPAEEQNHPELARHLLRLDGMSESVVNYFSKTQAGKWGFIFEWRGFRRRHDMDAEHPSVHFAGSHPPSPLLFDRPLPTDESLASFQHGLSQALPEPLRQPLELERPRITVSVPISAPRPPSAAPTELGASSRRGLFTRLATPERGPEQRPLSIAPRPRARSVCAAWFAQQGESISAATHDPR